MANTKQKKAAILVHGIFTRDDKAQRIDHIAPPFKDLGYDIIDTKVGFVDVFGDVVGFQNLVNIVANTVEDAIKNGYTKIICVGHSNGAALLHAASYKLSEDLAGPGKMFLEFIYVNPALNERYHPSICVDTLDVYYSPDDYVVWASQLFKLVLPWGKMGKVGYVGPNYPNCVVTNYNMLVMPFADDKGNPITVRFLGHHGAFDDPPVNSFSKLLVANVKA